MGSKEAARRCGNSKRANNARPGSDVHIIADFERYAHYAAWLLGIAFGVMFALAIVAG